MNAMSGNRSRECGASRAGRVGRGGLLVLLVGAFAWAVVGCGDDDDNGGGGGGDAAGAEGSSCAQDRDCREGLFCDLRGRAIVAKNADDCLFDCVFECDFGDDACEAACIDRCVSDADCPAFCAEECQGDAGCESDCLRVCRGADVPSFSDIPSGFSDIPSGFTDVPPPGGGGGGTAPPPPQGPPAGTCRVAPQQQPPTSQPHTPPSSSEEPAPAEIQWAGTWTITPNYTHDCNSRVRDVTQPSSWRITGPNNDLTATYSQNSNYTMVGTGNPTRLQLSGQWFATDHNNNASSPNSARNNVSILVEQIIDANTVEGTITGTYETSAVVTCEIQAGGTVRLTR